MTKEQYRAHLQSEYWKTVANAVKARAGWKCQLCNSGLDLHAHHRTYDHIGRELDHLEDLICLCGRCHAHFHLKSPPEPKLEPKPKKPKKQRKPKKERQKAFREKITEADGFKRHLSLARKVLLTQYDHEADCPPGSEILMSKALWAKMKTVNGGHTDATINAFKVPRPLEGGWRDRHIIGRTFPRETILEALKGRTMHKFGFHIRESLKEEGLLK